MTSTWPLLLRNVAAVYAVMLGAVAAVQLEVAHAGWLFVWAIPAGGLAVAQRDAAYQRGRAKVAR